jgi:hypothetical protein
VTVSGEFLTVEQVRDLAECPTCGAALKRPCAGRAPGNHLRRLEVARVRARELRLGERSVRMRPGPEMKP